mmetsp:Transcript_52002/g.110514  ORF Transcript_52002/g.110514 Transcript_52002/m.110514 type:complete len:329 (+) Transcript_52002:184-1170(+)
MNHHRRPSLTKARQLVAQQDGSGCQLGWPVAEGPDLLHGQLQQVLGEGPLDLARAVRAPEATHEVGRGWRHDLETQSLQDAALHSNDLGRGVGVVCEVGESGDLWHLDLLELGCDEHARDSDELQTLSHHHRQVQVGVDERLGQEESLWPEIKVAEMHLDEPVQQHAAHLLGDVRLSPHVGGPHIHLVFGQEKLRHDRWGIFSCPLGIVLVLAERSVEVFWLLIPLVVLVAVLRHGWGHGWSSWLGRGDCGREHSGCWDGGRNVVREGLSGNGSRGGAATIVPSRWQLSGRRQPPRRRCPLGPEGGHSGPRSSQHGSCHGRCRPCGCH